MDCPLVGGDSEPAHWLVPGLKENLGWMQMSRRPRAACAAIHREARFALCSAQHP